MELALLTPNPWSILPFALLLAAIALAPMACPAWWHRHYPKVAFSLGGVTLGYYLFGLRAYEPVLHTAHEYVSFVTLVGALYVVSGGIHLTVKGEGTPRENVLFLFVGALLANVLGTTGASMLLIRPWLRLNRYRITAHHVVFFIFIVANVGGCLTPIGDPPLFLGYLKGVPFWWVAEHCWPMWALALALLLGIFYVIDRRNYLRAPAAIRAQHAEPADEWRCDGLGNLFFLALILGAVFVNEPPFLREGLMFAAALGSWFTTRKSIHAANQFNFHPIQEVTILFAGIFATMMPALAWLQINAAHMGQPTPAFFFWGTGLLSSALDNAPTYLSFLSAIFGAFVDADVVNQVQRIIQTHGTDLAAITGPHAEQVRATFAALHKYHAAQVAAGTVGVDEIQVAFLLGNAQFNTYLVAVSLGAVFFGANTYIGNGPNFMVKAIAEQQRVATPGFLSYVGRYTLPFLLPVWLLIWWIFFRHG